MMKKWILLVLSLAATIAVEAEEVSQQEAQEKARSFMMEQHISDGGVRRAAQGGELTLAETDLKHLYAFNIEGGGFVIVSGDDRTIPVLGYSTTGTFDWDRMPESMKGWLQGYAKGIASLGDLKAKDGNPIGWSGNSRRAAKADLETLMTTKWNQTEPYYNMCPLIKGERCVTGCTCTATAQVMAYHKWPKEACKEIPGYNLYVSDKDPDQPLEKLDPVVFQWDKMLDDYSVTPGTAEQQQAVAQLMRYAGQGMKMGYSPSSSGSDSYLAADALKHYFGYDQSLVSVPRCLYNIDEWENLIYTEIANRRPVVYEGGMHTFVVDGYKNGLFHVNWGWGGYLDNYFSLSLLNPGSWDGTGAGTEGMDYSTPQNAIIGVKPAKEAQTYVTNHPRVSLGTMTIDATDATSLSVSYSIVGLKSVFNVKLAMAYKTADGKLTPLASQDAKGRNTLLETVYFDGNTGFSSLTAPTKLYPVISVEGFNEWKMLVREDVYVTATPAGDGKVTFSKEELKLEVKEINFPEPLKLNEVNMVYITIQNNGPEYRGVFLLNPTYGSDTKPTTDDQGVQGVFLPAGQQTKLTCMVKPQKLGKVVYNVVTEDELFVTYFNAEVVQSTGISNMANDGQAASDKYYNLNGQEVEHPSKGVYIHQGRKVIVE